MHTLTGHSSIFRVGTVMNAKWVTGTVHKSCLIPSTPQLVQKNGSSSLAEVGTRPGNCTCEENSQSEGELKQNVICNLLEALTTSSAQLTMQSQFCLTILCACSMHLCTCWCESKLFACNICIRSTPRVITHSAPCIIVADFHSTFVTVCTTSKPDSTICAWCYSKRS